MDDPWKQWAKWKKPDTKGQNCMICEGWGENEEWLINGVRNFFSEYKQFLNLASGNDLNKYTNILKRSEWWIQWYVKYVKTKLFFFFFNFNVIFRSLQHNLCFPGSSAGKESSCNAGDPGLIPGSGRCAREGIGYPLQYSWASLVA